jgi:hypothetical protein
VKSGISLCRCVAFMSVSIVALLWAYKRGRHQRWSDASGPSSLSTPRMTLAERQTILAVVDRPHSMHFYVGHPSEESACDA